MDSSDWPDGDVCCVLLPQLPIQVEVLRHPELDGMPLVLGPGPGDRRVVQLCSPEARAAGITPGLPIREVLALCRDAVILQPDPVYLDQVVQASLQRLQRVSPVVAYQPHHFFLGLQGLHAYYRGSLAALERAIRQAVPALLRPRIGIAAGAFVARLAAESAPAMGVHVVGRQQARSFLAPLPAHALPLPADALARLNLLGLRTIGDVAGLPFSAVQAQFGAAGARAWRLANGEPDAPIVPQRPQHTIRVSLRFDDPLSSVEAFHTAIGVLLARASADPRLGGRTVRRVRLHARLSTGASWEQTVTLKAALHGREALHRAIKDKLAMQNSAPSAPFEELALELLDLGTEVGRQPSLFAKNTQQQRQIAEAAQQLRARYGVTPLYHAVEVEPWSRIPERRWALAPCEP